MVRAVGTAVPLIPADDGALGVPVPVTMANGVRGLLVAQVSAFASESELRLPWVSIRAVAKDAKFGRGLPSDRTAETRRAESTSKPGPGFFSASLRA